ncbi:MAG: 2-octaprenyl-6-methoxyphenyl hydroxylase, partial [Motiliproteus sp.]|nr:2-octaprenyl-6-methoxyphenyl hydroxylase [Motiliproteus sp.]
MNSQYDIAIIGGGMVGASLAVSLLPAARKHGLKLAVIEAFVMPEPSSKELQPSYDARSTALSYGTRKLLEQMGVWSSLAGQVSAIGRIKVSDRGHFGATRLDARDYAVPALGYVVENRSLGQALLEKLHQDGEGVVDMICPAEVTEAKPLGKGMCLQAEVDGEQIEIEAGLVVMADGGRSTLREGLGIDYRQQDYGQFAVIANLTPDRPHDHVAYERFTAEGPMALLPLTDDGDGQARCALVWSVPETDIDEVLAWNDEQFIDRLHQQFGYRAGAFVAVGERHCYPLKLTRVQEQVRQGLVVLGNAAHTLHPIAGQGFNLALRGALTLSEVLLQALADKQPLGSMQALGRFQSQLSWDQEKTIGFSDQVTKLFSNNNSASV